MKGPIKEEDGGRCLIANTLLSPLRLSNRLVVVIKRNISPTVFPNTFQPQDFLRHDTAQESTDYA